MSPDRRRSGADAAGFPRVSGDEPVAAHVIARADEFSPRERG